MLKPALVAALPLLAAAVAALQPHPADTISLKPREGLSLRRTFHRERSSEIEQEMDDSVGTIVSEGTTTLVVLDEVLAAEGERATRLQRTYEVVEQATSFSVEAEWGDQVGEREDDCVLMGESVTFEWNADAEVYETESEADDDLIDELRFDLDLVGLLPEAEVDEGDEWVLDPEEFDQVLAFTEGLPFERQGNEHREAEAKVEESSDGKITLTYRGLRKVGGVELAVIEIEGQYERDLVMDHSQELDGQKSSTHSETSETRAVGGELLWDVKHGHLHSLELETEVESVTVADSLFGGGGQELESWAESMGTSTVTLEVSFERVDED
jgi:hypothetical protein